MFDLPPDRAFSLIVYWATRKASSQDEMDTWERQLWMPPKGVVPDEGPWTAEAERSTFANLKRQLQPD